MRWSCRSLCNVNIQFSVETFWSFCDAYSTCWKWDMNLRRPIVNGVYHNWLAILTGSRGLAEHWGNLVFSGFGWSKSTALWVSVVEGFINRPNNRAIWPIWVDDIRFIYVLTHRAPHIQCPTKKRRLHITFIPLRVYGCCAINSLIISISPLLSKTAKLQSQYSDNEDE